MKQSKLLYLSLIFFFTFPSQAQEVECENYEQFFKESRELVSWSAIYSWYQRFITKCGDDGVYAEMASEMIVKQLSIRWSELSHLNEIILKETKFKEFTLRHIDGTTNLDDISLILRHANGECPTKFSSICGEIASKAKEVLGQ